MCCKIFCLSSEASNSQNIKLQTTPQSAPLKKAYDGSKITAIALGIISIFFVGLGCLFLGIGTTPATMSVGLGVLPYLIGIHLVFLGTGTFLGAFAFSLVALYRKYQLNTPV